MRKRSKYRPKKVLVNPVGYVLEGMTPLVQHHDSLLNLKLKHHTAMVNLTQGIATRDDMDRLINMANMTEALYRLGFGIEYKEIVSAGLASLLAVARRGAESNRFILKAVEMKAINELIELHDAQMEVIAIKDIDRAIALVENEKKHKRMDNVIERK
jgi:hypothetical protein